jgi:gliding motility-associated protein GldE
LDLEPPSLVFSPTFDLTFAIGIVVIFILLFCTAIISGAEVAFFSLSDHDLETAENKNPRKAQMISKLLIRPKKLNATLLIANNFMNIAIVVLFVLMGKRLFSEIATSSLKLFIAIVFISFLILFFGKILPKVYANRNTLKFAMAVVAPISLLNQLLSPLSMPMRFVTLYFYDKLGKQKSNFSVDQLSQALELTSNEATSTEEQKILEGIVSFGNTDTKQVMSPRIDVFALEINETFSEIFPKIVEKEFSRIPVYRDNIDQIEGILFVKDILPHIDKTEYDWITLLREPFFVPENKKLDNLLKDFQNMKSHLAIVVDEYGGTSGLVSLEDIIEEIVGDISDEFDDENINFSQIDEKNFLFEGKIALKDFYRIVTVDEALFEKTKGEAETIAGLVLEILGNFPKKGQKIPFGNCVFTIEVVDKKRIKQLKVTLE